MRSSGLGLSIRLSTYLRDQFSAMPLLFSLRRKASKLSTTLSWRSSILAKERSLTANSPRLVSYFPLTKILVLLLSHRGSPWISSTMMHPSPQTSMADVFSQCLTYSSISVRCPLRFSQRMQLSSSGHMYSGVASLYCFKFSKTKLDPQSMSLNWQGCCSCSFNRMFSVFMSECTILCCASRSSACAICMTKDLRKAVFLRSSLQSGLYLIMYNLSSSLISSSRSSSYISYSMFPSEPLQLSQTMKARGSMIEYVYILSRFQMPGKHRNYFLGSPSSKKKFPNHIQVRCVWYLLVVSIYFIAQKVLVLKWKPSQTFEKPPLPSCLPRRQPSINVLSLRMESLCARLKIDFLLDYSTGGSSSVCVLYLSLPLLASLSARFLLMDSKPKLSLEELLLPLLWSPQLLSNQLFLSWCNLSFLRQGLWYDWLLSLRLCSRYLLAESLRLRNFQMLMQKFTGRSFSLLCQWGGFRERERLLLEIGIWMAEARSA